MPRAKGYQSNNGYCQAGDGISSEAMNIAESKGISCERIAAEPYTGFEVCVIHESEGGFAKKVSQSKSAYRKARRI